MTVMQTQEPEELVSRSEAAKMIGVQEIQIRRYQEQGRLPAAGIVPAGKLPRTLYRKSDVQKIKSERDLIKGSEEVV